jgi:hypothetical protein
LAIEAIRILCVVFHSKKWDDALVREDFYFSKFIYAQRLNRERYWKRLNILEDSRYRRLGFIVRKDRRK